MTFEDAWKLLDYHYWARDRMWSALEALSPENYTRDLGNSFPSVRDTLVHMYAGEWVWYSRWTGYSPTEFPNPEDFPDLDAIRDAIRSFTGEPQRLNLPSAPKQPIHYATEIDRPQPRLDRDREHGMAVTVGRLRPCPLLDIRMVALVHNTIRGAAGAALLNAELLEARGLL